MRNRTSGTWMRRAGVVAAAVQVLVCAVAPPAARAVTQQSIATFDVRTSPPAIPDEKKLRDLEDEALEEVNDERRDAGIPLLRMSPDLSRLAREYSREMVERGFFDHQDPDGLRVDTRASRAGITWQFIGENIARNRGFRNPAYTAVKEWMKSAGHRENILNDRYAETGIGAWIAPDRTVYFTQIFVQRT